MADAESKNEALVRRFFEDALNSGDLEKIRPCFHPDATWTPMAKPGIPGAGVHRGRKGIVDEFLAPVRGLFVDGDPRTRSRTCSARARSSRSRRTAPAPSAMGATTTTAMPGSSRSGMT